MTSRVPVAVATLLIQQDTLLLGRRYEQEQFIGWQCPGGYLNSGETLEQAATRICQSKAGVQPGQLTAGPFTNNLFNKQTVRQHTFTLYFIARDFQIVDQQQFQDAQFKWSRFKMDDIPQPRFLPLDILLKQIDIKQL